MGRRCHDDFHHDFCDCKDCCFPKEERREECDFVKDRVCCNWCIPVGNAQPVYTVQGLNVFASGTISVDCCDRCIATVSFLRDGTPVGNDINVFAGSCLTFTAANFNEIVVVCHSGGDVACTTCSGKICVTPRYQVMCEFNENKGCGCC